MKQFFKKHIGIAVLLIIVFAFPVSLSTQARLNMRIIVTGLAIDKLDGAYEVTAQIVKTKPSAGSSEEGASIEFVSEQAETITSAIAKLSYKSGKVAGFSHTNFILLGKEMLDDDLMKSLNYFLRDTTIKDSALVVFAKESAKDEIQKTKDLGLSVGLGLQKVFIYKEKESDATMTTLLAFMNDSLSNSQTAVVSELELGSGTKSEGEESSESSGGESSSSQTDKSINQEENANNSSGKSAKETSSESSSSESGSGSESSSSESSSEGGSESGEQSGAMYFNSMAPINCFVGGKFVGKFETDDEIMGYMLAKNKCHSEDISLENLTFGGLKNAKVGVEIKYKNNGKKLRFEDEKPCLDITVNIVNSSIKEIQNDEFLAGLTDEEFEFIKSELQKAISSKIGVAFDKSKQLKADIFGAYELAYKFHYKKFKNNFENMQEFIDALRVNVSVNVSRLEY